MRAGLLAALLWLAGASAAMAQEHHLLVIVGLGGEARYREQFHAWASAMVDAARDRHHLRDEHVVYLGERPDLDPARIDGRSTREEIVAAAERMAGGAGPGDRVFIVLFGHGSFNGGESRFNLPGPDMSAADFATLLDRFAPRPVTFVSTASASGGFVEALSGPGRTIITATKSGNERNETVFGAYVVEALGSDDADLDKDGRTSMLEVFQYARRRVLETYEQDGRLLTEHAVLDDDGDGKGTDAPDGLRGDGAVARTMFFTASEEDQRVAGREAARADADPELRALYGQRRELETKLEALRLEKDQMDSAAYAAELERLLTELARTARAIREREGQEP